MTYRTRQEIFDICAVHLLTQNEKAFGYTEGLSYECNYRYGKLKCAIGALIPDDKYTPNLEGKAVYDDTVRIAANIGSGDLSFADKLQIIHDNGAPEYWYRDLQNLAVEYNLNRDCLKPFKPAHS